jgi:gamma-butyrobetaine dioxygenase
VKRADIDDISAFLTELFCRRGAEAYLGEAVSMAEHMLQAAHRAGEAGASDSQTAAALLHDVGHFVDDLDEDAWARGGHDHAAAGADLLAPWFGPAVTEPIRLHVPAKRYLCAVEPAYFGGLSPASVHTLTLQGGVMTADEVSAFEATPYGQAAVELRRWDDAGKVAGAVTARFADYGPLLQRLLRGGDSSA